MGTLKNNGDQMTKQDFIKECNRQMANITDPKRQSSTNCRANKKAYKFREIRKIMNRKKAEKKAKDDAKRQQR